MKTKNLKEHIYGYIKFITKLEIATIFSTFSRLFIWFSSIVNLVFGRYWNGFILLFFSIFLSFMSINLYKRHIKFEEDMRRLDEEIERFRKEGWEEVKLSPAERLEQDKLMLEIIEAFHKELKENIEQLEKEIEDNEKDS